MKKVEIKFAVGYAVGVHDSGGKLLLHKNKEVGTRIYDEALLFDTYTEASDFAKTAHKNSEWEHFIVAVEKISEPTIKAVV